ncbi:crossover junction endodeoxyribonuclease RuvC [Anaplasma phagocytophilum str. Norway variant1]|uniref:Crossover junction endodeoxyribonuclease RuvC n=1 Tax=Anaplasma phagocytophilum str. Norway variant1 TaxID=1392506 RepID=A0A7H9DXL6_ANAPH|nr:crossover junction endodeoxyribonuclease RuvC [Anaplasma phagocytophilum]QLL66342.1 crossover junction endodeoxyribonuclease RuvC [Anaplasma phagocytophilum str. Norway variant1]
MLVFGLDPGLNYTGWAVVLKKPTGSLSLIDSGTICTTSCYDLNDKLFCIFSGLSAIIQKFSVSVASVENVFVNLNPKASMFLCYARAASLLACLSSNVKIFEYSPTKIKKCVFGNGRASKEQIAFVVRSSLGLSEDASFSSHASDAIAAALCHIFSSGNRYGI